MFTRKHPEKDFIGAFLQIVYPENSKDNNRYFFFSLALLDGVDKTKEIKKIC
jgi:hypothetical protein